jgi:hypothetical protein
MLLRPGRSDESILPYGGGIFKGEKRGRIGDVFQFINFT